MATSNMTIGDLKGFLELSKSMAGGLTITDFGALFDRIEQLLKSFNQWTPELESSLALAEKELSANPGLFDIGKAEFVSSVDKLLAKYPANTLLKDIPEFSGSGGDGSGDLPPITSIGDFDIAKIAAIHAEVKVQFDPVTRLVTVDGAGYSYKLPNVERVEFNDGVLAFDIDGTAGQVVRLYQAALDRLGDVEGLGYWIRHRDGGLSDLAAVADSFMNSPEFVSRYGTEATVSNSQFVALLYTNALGRAHDEDGFNYWLQKLDGGQTSRRDLLVFFSESDENQTNTASAYDDGIWYV